MIQPKKILFVANEHLFFIQFLLPQIQWLKNQGHTVHVASGDELKIADADQSFLISLQRSPFRLKNVKAFWELKHILCKNRYELIHCHTPMGGALARLAAMRFRKKHGTKVMYTAHGFYFYRNAPVLNWLLYFPVEKWLARHTDVLITINREDYRNAIHYRFKSQVISPIAGVGVDTNRFCSIAPGEKHRLRKKLGFAETDFIIIYAAEFIQRKNHIFMIKALAGLTEAIPDLKIIFAGSGKNREIVMNATRSVNLSSKVCFPGYVDRMEHWLAISDLAVSTSEMEGLPMNVAEAMATGLPVVASRIRGHVDLVEDGVNGLLFDVKDTETFVRHIETLYHSPELREKLGSKARETIKPFGIGNVLPEMAEIYSKYLSL